METIKLNYCLLLHQIQTQQGYTYREKDHKYPLTTMIKLIGKFPNLYFSLHSIDLVSLSSTYPIWEVIEHPVSICVTILFISRKLIHTLILKVSYDKKTRLSFKYYKLLLTFIQLIY